jgi:phosphatidate cytidylyltransferase
LSAMPSRLTNSQVFRKRTITTMIGVPVVAALVWFDSPIPWFTLLAAVWGAGGAYEFYGLVKRSRGLAPLTYFGTLWVVLFIISPHFTVILLLHNIQPGSVLVTAAVILPLLILLWRKGKENAFLSWAWTMAGIFYVGWLLSFLVALRNVAGDGRGWVFLVILCTFASDICAYLVGRVLGKHKIAPYISPNKSWEGSISGVAGSIILSVAVVYFFKLPVSSGAAVILGILISVIGQLGDLVKSLFKRNMEVKDSGNILPGHGGFLDRMDSLAFAGVLIYYIVAFIGPVI